jgi:hypothetical protein
MLKEVITLMIEKQEILIVVDVYGTFKEVEVI